jgi:hypothetical protein
VWAQWGIAANGELLDEWGMGVMARWDHRVGAEAAQPGVRDEHAEARAIVELLATEADATYVREAKGVLAAL